VLPSGQKLTLDLLATISLEVVSFHAYAPLPALVIFNCILEVVFCEGVQHRLRSVYQFIFSRGNRKGEGGWGTIVKLFLVKNSLVKNEVWDGALSWCYSQFFCRQSSGWSRSTFSRNRRRTLQECAKLTIRPARKCSLRAISLMPKKMISMLTTFHMSRLFSVSVSLDFQCTAHAFFPECLSNQCQGLRRNFPEIFTKSDAVPLSDPSRNPIRPDTRLQIIGRKNQHGYPAAWNFVHWLPSYASTFMYCCIVLPQLLCWHQSLKLWIPPRIKMLLISAGGVSDETVKYGLSSAGLRLKSDCSGKAQKQFNSKLQTRPLVREGATKYQSCSCLKEISWRKKNWSQAPMGAGHQDRLADWLSVIN
jgi:hypothetical protein